MSTLLLLGAVWGVFVHGLSLPAKAGTNLPAFVVKSWRTIDGLPQNSVNAIAQSPDGYLWVGTRGGLARFDGVRFVRYGLAEGLKGWSVESLAEDGHGGLWIGTAGGGLSRLRQGVFTTLTTADGLLHNDVLALARDGADGLWVGTREGLQHLGPDGFKRVGETEGVRGAVTALAVTPAEGLWFSVAEAGLFQWRDGRCTYVGASFKSRKLHPYSFVVDKEGALWVGMGNHVVLRRTDGKWTEFNASHGVPLSYFDCLALGPAGEIWAGSHMAGLHVFRDGRFHEVPGADQSIRSLMVTRDGLVWAGTEWAGLTRLAPGSVTSYPVGDEPNRGQVTGVAEEPAGHFWVNRFGVGAFNGPLDRLEPAKGEQGATNFPFLRGALRMQDGTVYLAGAKRLLTKPRGANELRSLDLPDNLHALCEGVDGSLWLGTRDGELKHLVEGAAHSVTNGRFGATIVAIARGPGASLWVATRGAGLHRWDAGKVERWTTREGLPTDVLLALHSDAKGTLWIGTSGGGLAWLENGRLHAVNSTQGLADDVIMQVLEDGDGHLWAGGHQGIFRVSKEDLRDVAAGRARAVHPLTLDESDGMLTGECTGGFSPAALRSQSGVLYFSTLRGVVAVDPGRFTLPASPLTVLIEEVKLGGQPIPARGGKVSLPPGAGELEIQYTAFNYAKPEQIHFRHRLGDGKGKWVEVEGSRSARYSHLPPGEYAFEVTAANPDLHWNESGAVLALAVPPFYWQTIWFRGAAGLLLLAAVGGAVRWRYRARREVLLAEMAHLRREAAEREKADQKFHLAVEASPNGIVLVNPEGRILLVNAHTEELFSYAREELIGQSVEMLLPERFRGTHRGERKGFFHTPKARTMGAGRELSARRKDGTEFPVEIGLSPIQTEEGTLVLAALVDITSRKQAEHELTLQRNELNHLSRVATLSELSSSLAHELNQPLTAILSNAQAAQRFLAHNDADLNELREILGDIVQEDKRAGEVIRRLRLLLKKGEVQHELIDLNEVVLEVLKLLRSDLVNQGVSARTELAPELPAIKGDRVQLQQVLLNLVMNACHAMSGQAPKDRLLVLRTVAANDSGVRAEIVDQGCGIPPESLERIFEPFYTTRTEGMGLGLAVCRTILDAHGGTMWAVNNPGRGATVCFQIPAAPESRS